MNRIINDAVCLQTEERFAILTFDDKTTKVNTWNTVISEGFFDAIEAVRDMTDGDMIDGMIIISGKSGNFHAGADLKTANSGESRFDMIRRYEYYHALMNKISALHVPTLAAINGHALGGGLELALSCDYRIARTFEKTQLGLPEISIGRFPCYGGTQRLPRLIGMQAVPLIMESRRLTAQEARQAGIVDKVIDEEEDLLQAAVQFLKSIISGAVTVCRTEHDFSGIRALLAPYEADYLHGPDVPKAAELVFRVFEMGLPLTLSEGLEYEKKYRVQLADDLAAVKA